MKPAIIATLLLCLAAPAQADELYALGQDICAKSLSGEFSGLDVDQYRVEIEATGMDREAICACVGDNVAQIDPDLGPVLRNEVISEDFAYLAFVMDQNIPDCMEKIGSENHDGDLVGTEFDWQVQDGIYDAGDYAMCQSALEGGLMMPGFDEGDVLARMKAKGLSSIPLCQCSATYMKSISDRLEAEIGAAQNPSVIYNSALAGSIEQCL